MSYGRGLGGCACKQASGGCGCRDGSLGLVPASVPLRPVTGGATSVRPGQIVASPVVAATPRGVTTLPVASPQTRVLTFKAPQPSPTPPSVLPTVSTTPIYQAAHQAAVSGDGDTAAQLASLATSLDQAAQASAIPTPPPVPVVPDSPAPNASLVPIIALYGVIALALLYLGKRKY